MVNEDALRAELAFLLEERKRISAAIKATRLSLKPKRASFKAQSARMDARGDKIRELHARGMSWAAMGYIFGTTPGAIRRQATKMGLPANYKGRVRIIN